MGQKKLPVRPIALLKRKSNMAKKPRLEKDKTEHDWKPNNRVSFAPDFTEAPRKDAVSLKSVLVPKSSLPPVKTLNRAGAQLKIKLAVDNAIKVLKAFKDHKVADITNAAIRRVDKLENALEAKDNRIDNDDILKKSRELRNLVRNVGDFVMLEYAINDVRAAILQLCDSVDSSIVKRSRQN